MTPQRQLSSDQRLLADRELKTIGHHADRDARPPGTQRAKALIYDTWCADEVEGRVHPVGNERADRATCWTLARIDDVINTESGCTFQRAVITVNADHCRPEQLFQHDRGVQAQAAQSEDRRGRSWLYLGPSNGRERCPDGISGHCPCREIDGFGQRNAVRRGRDDEIRVPPVTVEPKDCRTAAQVGLATPAERALTADNHGVHGDALADQRRIHFRSDSVDDASDLVPERDRCTRSGVTVNNVKVRRADAAYPGANTNLPGLRLRYRYKLDRRARLGLPQPCGPHYICHFRTVAFSQLAKQRRRSVRWNLSALGGWRPRAGPLSRGP